MTILVIFVVGGHTNLALLRNNKGPPKNMSLKRVVAPDGETTVGTSQVVPPTPGTEPTKDKKGPHSDRTRPRKCSVEPDCGTGEGNIYFGKYGFIIYFPAISLIGRPFSYVVTELL